jgi:hypothetical protein
MRSSTAYSFRFSFLSPIGGKTGYVIDEVLQEIILFIMQIRKCVNVETPMDRPLAKGHFEMTRRISNCGSRRDFFLEGLNISIRFGYIWDI